MKNLVVILGLLLLCACTEQVVNKPEDLIPESEMVAIYFDISLINASKNSGYDKFREHGIDSKDYLFKKYGIDSARLSSSAAYYTSKPLIHERIYTRVEEKLDSLKSLLEEQMKQVQEERVNPGRPVDSLKFKKDTVAAGEVAKDTP